MDVPYTFNGRTSYDPDGLVGDSSDLEFLDFLDGTTSNDSTSATNPGRALSFTCCNRRERNAGEERTLSIRIQNPKPIISVKIFDIWYDGDLVTTSTPIAEGASFDYSHTFDDDGNVVTTPGQMLYFDSLGTRDDRTYEGRFISRIKSL